MVVLTKQAIKPNFKEHYFSIYQICPHFGFSFIICQSYLSCPFLFMEATPMILLTFQIQLYESLMVGGLFVLILLGSFSWPMVLYLKNQNKIKQTLILTPLKWHAQGVHLQNIC